MHHETLNYKAEITREIKDLTETKAKEVLDFICFVKHKEVLSKIDPTQAYFYAPKWQAMEKKAEEDIKKGRVSREYGAEEINLLFADIKKGKRKSQKLKSVGQRPLIKHLRTTLLSFVLLEITMKF